MKESKRRPVRVKGVVLVMVITLLFVLVVMLMATLTVVGNANKRTITKFEENQAYYTARSALGVYITGMLEMDETAALGSGGAKRAGKALSNKFNDVSESNISVFAHPAGSTNYTDFGGNDIVEGFVYQQELFGYLTPKYKLDGIDRGDVLISPSDDANWTLTENWEDKAENQQDYRVTYKAEMPEVNGVTATGMSGNVGVMATEPVDITVELLRMVYMKSDDTVITDGVLPKTNSEGDANLADVDWSKTYYRLKVTATAKIKQGTGGVNEGTVSVILEPQVTNSPGAFTNALTTFEETAMSTKGFTVGGASASAPAGATNSVYTAQNNSTWVGSYAYRYDAVKTAASGFTWRLFEGDNFVVQGGYLEVTNLDKIEGEGDVSATSQEDLDKRPYIYSGGFKLSNSQLKVGNGNDSAVDLILYHNEDFADNYSWKATGTNGVGDPKRIAFVSGDDYQSYDIYGDVYCDGDMYISCKTKFHGNVYCTGNVFIGGAANEWKFDKKLSLGGGLYKGDGTAVTDLSNAGTLTQNDGSLSAMRNENCPWGNTWDSDIDAEPTIKFGGLSERSDIQVPTVKNITETYRDSSKNVIPADQFIIKQTKQADIKLTVKNNAKDFKPSSTPTTSKEFTSNGSTTTLTNVIDPTDPNVATYNSATDFYEMKLNANDFMNVGTTFYLDATQGNVQVQLTGQTGNASHPKIVVIGDGNVVFTIADNDTFQMNGSILSYDIYQMLQNGDTFNLGDIPEGSSLNPPKAPKIYYYIGKDATLDMYNADGDTWAGYMYGPEAKFNTNAGGIGKTINYTYNGNPSSGSFSQSSVYCYGSMVFESISAQNDVGVAFIDPGNSGGGAPADGKVIWKRQRYLNR